MGGTPYNQQPGYQQPQYQAPSGASKGPTAQRGGGELRTMPQGVAPGGPAGPVGIAQASSLGPTNDPATFSALTGEGYVQEGAGGSPNLGMGTGTGKSAYIPLPHNQPELSAATYRLFRSIADERGQAGNSARYEDYANRAFENPLPALDPNGVGIDAYGNRRWDYSRGPGQLTGSQYGDNTGLYNRGDGTHPGGLSTTLTPYAPLRDPTTFSALTGEGYTQAPGPHPVVGPGGPGSQSTAALGGRSGPPGATTLYPPNSIRDANIGPRPSRPTGGAIPSRITGTPRAPR